MLAWFQSLMPKQGRFQELIETHGLAITEAARELSALLDHQGSRDGCIDKIAHQERLADALRISIIDDARSVFVTPFDRSAIVALINAMDDAIDQMHQTAKTIRRYDVTMFDPEMRDLARIAVDASDVVMTALPLLRSVSKYGTRLLTLTAEVVALEERADALHERGLRTLFETGGDATTFVIRREVYSHLERILDRLEDVASEIHGLVIDHA
ncbi:MAG: nuclease PIN [Hyphomonas sp.]|jgi:uncharacterized protein|nr:DUF47 family protein [Hyphomonas sp.]MBA4228617.1 nuclease PIN [Hyphomonas sp.]